MKQVFSVRRLLAAIALVGGLLAACEPPADNPGGGSTAPTSSPAGSVAPASVAPGPYDY